MHGFPASEDAMTDIVAQQQQTNANLDVLKANAIQANERLANLETLAVQTNEKLDKVIELLGKLVASNIRRYGGGPV